MAEETKEEPRIRVTDKRMFTADGELREDFQHLETAGGEETAAEAPAEPPSPVPDPPSAPSEQPGAPAAEPTDSERSGRVEMPETSGAVGEPGFLDLVGTLAEPIAVYLGDAKLPDGHSAENLDVARFYIDLLDVLRTKTAGNLTAQESSVLEELLYQLRMRYVRKRG